MGGFSDDVDYVIGNQKQDAIGQLKLSVSNALTVNPDQEAQAIRAAGTLNIPVDSVRDNLPEAQQQVRMQQTDFGMLSDRFPKTSSFLTNQQNANIAHDDVNNLQDTEQILGEIRDTVSYARSGFHTANRGIYGAAQAGFDFAGQLVDPLVGTILPQNPLRIGAAVFGEQAAKEGRIADAIRPKGGFLKSSIGSGIESFTQNAMNLPLLFMPGGQEAYMTAMVTPVFGNAYQDAKNKGIDQNNALVFAASQAAIEYATEKIPVSNLVRDLKIGSPFYKLVEHQLVGEVVGEQFATALQDLNEWAVLNPEKPFSDYISERPSAALQTLIATLVGVGGQVTLTKGIQKVADQFTGQSDEVRRAEYSADLLNKLDILATASKVRGRDTETFQTFLQSALEDGPVDHVYIEPKVLLSTLEKSGISFDEFAKTSPLVSAQLQESLATNTDLSIPITEFATHLAGKTYSQQLIEHLKTDPEGMSRAEAQEFMNTQGEQLKVEVERELGKLHQDQAFNDSRDRVYQMVLDNLNEANRFTQQKNEIDATLIASRTAVRAAQLKMTPEELFKKHLLKVSADTVSGDQVLHQALKSHPPKGWMHSDNSSDAKKLWSGEGKNTAVFWTHLNSALEQLLPNTAGYSHSIDKSAIGHIKKNHGNAVYEKERGQIAITASDIAAIPSIVSSYDDIRTDLKTDKGSQRIAYAKRIADGILVYIEDISNKRQNMRGVTMWKYPSNEDVKSVLASALEYGAEKAEARKNGLLSDALRSLSDYESDAQTPPAGTNVSENPDSGKSYDQSAFHGTPYNFDKFSLEHLGSGEGAQAYGWGLYFAGQRSVAEFYRKKLTIEEPYVNGELLDQESNPEHLLAKVLEEESGNVDEVKNVLNRLALPGGNKSVANTAKKAIQLLDDGARPVIEYKKPDGQLYEVDIPEDNNMLLWDKPISEQPDSVKNALPGLMEKIKKVLPNFSEEATGAGLYKGLQEYHGHNQESASKTLHAAGIDGIKYLDGNSRGSGKGAYNYVIFDDNAIQILNTYYQNKDEVRGQIAFGSDLSKSPSIITLLKSADLSTFLHESGHFFFESDINLAAELNRTAIEMGDSFLTEGERQLMADVSKMLEWHGLQGSLNDQLNQWYNLSPEERRSYHERTAESFERYLFEGKAPSIELQRIFQAFRAWLMNVYKSIEDFVARNPEAGKLDDSIRQVFDRMLASTEQIKLAEQGRSMMPLFDSANQGGMNTEEFAAYHALDVDASMEAIESLEAKGLRDMQWLHNARSKFIKKLQKQNAARRSEVMMDARRAILSQPLYRAWTFLTNRMDKDQRVVPESLPKSDKDTVTPEVDSLFTAIAKLGGLKRDEIDALLGLDPKMKSPMPAFGKYVFKRNGGESLDFMGEVLANYGYLSVDEHGKFDTRELEDKIDAELRGEPQYSVEVDPRLLGIESRAGEGLNLEELGAGRLDFGELVGLPVPRDQINQLEALKMVAMNGIHPDLVAEQFGIGSGDELVQLILSSPSPKEAIANLTDQMMLERYGDITSQEALEKAADAAIHNDARARFVATELNALNKMVGKPKILASAAKEFAKNMIDRLIIRNLKPSPYAASEVRAAKAAEKALKEGKLEQAAADKRNQIINTYATKAVYDAQDEIEKGLRYLGKFDNEGTRKALDVDYLDQIDAILERFDLRKGTTLKNIDKRKSLAAWITQQEELGIEVDLPNKVKAEAYRQSYKDMSVEEFRGLVESIKQIEHLGRLKEKLLTAQDNRRFSDIINQMVESINENAGNREVNNRTRDTLGNKAIRLFKGFFAAHRKTASLARELDGYKESGPMWEYLIRTMNDAGNHEATMRADATHRLSALLDPILKGGKFGGKGQFFKSLGVSLNRGEQLVIALNMGNDGNMQRLLDGRGWQIEQLVPVMKNLTAADWNFVQNVWDFFDSYRPMIAEKERRIMGKEPNWVEPQRLTVTTKEGEQLELRGGYFPIVYDPRESGRAEQFADAENAKQMMRGAFNAATTRRSFTKDRAEEVTGRPLILTWDALFRGVNDVIHDLAWHEWVIDANRIIKNESLDHAIRSGFGADVIAQFKSAITDIAKGDSPDMDAVSKFLTPLRSGAAVAGLGFNIMNAMIQPLGLTQSMVRIGTKWVALGVAEWAKSPIGLVKQVHEKSEFMRNRARTLNREVNEVQSIVQGKGEIREKLDALMFAPMQSLQLVADMPTWWGAYQKALADPTLIDSENGVDEATAIARADQAVLDSQGGGQIKDLARMQRGTNLQKLFTLFYGYFSAAYNLGVDQVKQTNFKNPLEVMGLAWDFLLLYSVPAVLSSLIKDALMPSGDGDDDWEKIARKLASEQISYLMGLMVGLREATPAIQYMTGTKMFDGAYGGPAGLRFFQELDKLGKQIGQGELDRALARSVINVVGIAFHLPSAQINRTIDGVIAISEGETQNPSAVLFGYQH